MQTCRRRACPACSFKKKKKKKKKAANSEKKILIASQHTVAAAAAAFLASSSSSSSSNRLRALEEGRQSSSSSSVEEKKAVRGRKNGRWSVVVLVVFFLIAGGAFAVVWLREEKEKYLAIVDAGSSGCRAHVFSYEVDAGGRVVVDPTHASLKATPGLSFFEHNPEAAGASLKPLLEFVGSEAPPGTPIYLKATAGLRALNAEASRAILASVRSTLREYHPGYAEAEIISGIQEAGFGWMAANYLNGAFYSKSWTGVVEMGGASAQVSQLVPEEESVDKYSFGLEFGEERYRIYATSYLGYGMERARERLSKLMSPRETGDPCVATGAPGGGETVYDVLPGAGSYDECKAWVSRLFNNTERCDYSDCSNLIPSGTFQPHNLAATALLGFENIYYTAASLNLPLPDIRVRDFETGARNVCDNTFLVADGPKLCFAATYIHLFLHEGLKLPEDKVLKVQQQVEGHDLDWALGAAIYEAAKSITK
ncbi:hypothetical protein CTAYLR_008763 [Chrysophaeum taylorii]|uniref:Apyrase n=1 Tax=Chrysophaeum taylorii TaxID=2483200 RepID=A0AAD7XLH3_9STRA|nr:hypothetical protein CTAYLR_008763 [Chrysophaeum taylorii]